MTLCIGLALLDMTRETEAGRIRRRRSRSRRDEVGAYCSKREYDEIVIPNTSRGLG